MWRFVLALALGPALTAQEANRPRQAEPPRRPQLWAVVVGIDGYKAPIPACEGALRDSRLVSGWFRETAGWDRTNVLELNETGVANHPADPATDVTALEPTRENLKWAVEEWLRHRAKPEDVAVIYFAGQAVAVPPAADATFGSPGRDGLLPIDANLNDPSGTVWFLDQSLDALAGGGPGSILLWLDTSPLGRGKALPRIAEEDKQAPARRLLERLTRWPRVSAWIAATDGLADDAPEAAAGPFVAVLAEALGTVGQPRSVVEVLARLQRDERTNGRGFAHIGGVPAHLNLWPLPFRTAKRPATEILLQRGHSEAVTACLFTPDDRLITASKDSTIRVWGTRDRALLDVRTVHLNGVSAVALGPDGRFLLSGDGMGRVFGHDLGQDRDPAARRTLAPERQVDRRRIEQIVALADGRHFATRDDAGRTVIWEVAPPALSAQRVDLEKIGRIAAPTTVDGDAPVVWAALAEDGRLHVFTGDGALVRAIETPASGSKSALLLPDGGRLAVVGTAKGLVVAYDLSSGAEVRRFEVGAAVGSMAASPLGVLAVATRDAIQLAATRFKADEPPTAPIVLDAPGRSDELAFSADGRLLTARAANGRRLLAWSLSDPAKPSALPIGSPGVATAVAISPNGQMLAIGEGTGGFQFREVASGQSTARVAAGRGQVEELDASPDGRLLLERTREGAALVWDLSPGRGARALPGVWQSGAIVRRDMALYAAMVGKADDQLLGRKIVLVPLADTPRAVIGLAELSAEIGGRAVIFGRLAASGDGRYLAAIEDRSVVGDAGVDPAIGFWDLDRTLAKGPSPLLAAPAIDARPTSLSFAPDNRSLLFGFEDGSVAVYPIGEAGPGSPIVLPPAVVVGEALMEVRAVEADPADPRQIATADRSGVVRLWSIDDPKPLPMEVANLDEAVHDLAFSRDGRTLAAATITGKVVFWSKTPQGDWRRAEAEPKGGHTEEVLALVTLPEAPAPDPADPQPPGERADQVIVSGSRDTSIRFWDAERGDVIGTLSAVLAEGDAVPSMIVDWVAFASDGRFSGSPRGIDQIRMIRGAEVVAPEQLLDARLDPKLNDFRFAEGLWHGRRPGQPLNLKPPATLAMGRPPSPSTDQRKIVLSLALGGGADGQSLRLYHDNQPITVSAADFVPDGEGRYRAEVRLHGGTNRFYAMAGHKDAGKDAGFDVRSEEVRVEFTGPDQPGRLHVLALGVSEYRHRPLQFSDDDARDLARHFIERARAHPNDFTEGPGQELVLTETDVSVDGLRNAFTTLREATADRPEDTVVVFVAGHTEVFDDRFHLLLNGFPFPAAPAGGDQQVAQRGSAGDEKLELSNPRHALPYYEIERGLSQLKALQRLVIVDACQAEAIFDDRGVLEVRRALDEDALRGRSAYILAARRGEAAGEASALEHGLLSFTLLHGLKAEKLPKLPENLATLIGPTADLDGNSIVSTEELRDYVNATLPALAANFPLLEPRALEENLSPQGTPGSLPEMPSFPIVGVGPPGGD